MTEQSLLFALFALRNSLITRQELIATLEEWVRDRTRTIDQLLLARGAIVEADRQLISQLVLRHLARTEKEAAGSLRSMLVESGLSEELLAASNPDLQATLSLVGSCEETLPFVARDAAQMGQRSSIGHRFQVKQRLDQGGLGIVSIALDRELHRDVALKEIRPDRADDPFHRSKFLLEAEVTGGLEHPGIVPVYGLGSDGAGRPFYAMRLIRGANLREHIRRFHHERKPRAMPFDGMPLRKLLRRFLDICDAVAYAHSRGVVHRDLKPGNVMLGPHGETLVVDWGLAKLVDIPEPVADATSTDTIGENAASSGGRDQPAEPSLRPTIHLDATQIGTLVGTAAYAPPEQMTGDHARIGPCSDVYGLGAILYEILTGVAPARGASLQETIDNVVHGRLTAPRAVEPLVPRPLEAICLRALQREPRNRYQSVAELQAEIERWLDDQPIAALPDGPVTRVRRWLRRNRGVATTASIALVLLTIVLGASALVLEKARRSEQQLAIENGELARSEQTQRKLATVENERAKAATQFLIDSLAMADPGEGGRNLSIAEVLDRALSEVPRKFGDLPYTRSAVLNALAMAFTGLGQLEKADPLYREALALDQSTLGQGSPDTLTARSNLATNLYKLGRIDEAEQLLEENLKLVGPSRLSAHELNNYAEIQVSKRNNDQASRYFMLADRKARAEQPPDRRLLAVIAMNRARVELQEENYAAAVDQYQHALQELQEAYGEEHPMTLICVTNLAVALERSGNVDEAAQMEQRTIEMKNRILGPHHPDTLASKNNYAIRLMNHERGEEAVPYLEEVFAHMLEFMAIDDARRLDVAMRLARLHRLAGRPERAQPYLEAVLSTYRDAGLPIDGRYAGAARAQAKILAEQGRHDAARTLLQSTLEQLTPLIGTDHEITRDLQKLLNELPAEPKAVP